MIDQYQGAPMEPEAQGFSKLDFCCEGACVGLAVQTPGGSMLRGMSMTVQSKANLGEP